MIIDPESVSKAELYMLLLRIVRPRPIAWVSTVSSGGVLNLAPFSFFTAVTSKPPTICFSPARLPDGSKKDSLVNVEATGEFVVNVVPEELVEKMNDTAIDFPAEVDEFESAGLTPVPGDLVSPPRVKESPVNMECKLLQVVPVGEDGALVIGEIVRFHVSEDVLKDGKIDSDLLKLVGRMGGFEYTRTRDRFILPRKKYKP